MKKFLSHVLPLCLALVICVCSLAVPAFAAAIPPDIAVIPEESTFSGVWSFKIDAPVYEGEVSVPGSFLYNGYSCRSLYVHGSEITFVYLNRDESVNTIVLRNADGAWLTPVRQFEVVGLANCSDAFFSWLSIGAIELDFPLAESGDSIFSVFGGISSWIVSAIGTVMPMFYTETTGLTFIGILAVAGLAFAVIFLIIAVIRRFLHFG